MSRIDPRRGTQSTFGAVPAGTEPTGIAIEANGDLLVSTYRRIAGFSWVLRIEPGAAGFSLAAIFRGGAFTGIALEADGSILVPVTHAGTRPPPTFFPAVLRIDPQGGAFELASTHVPSPTDLTVESSGEIVVSVAAGAVVRIDPGDGSQTLLVEDPALLGASAIAVVLPEVAIDIRPSQVVLPGRRMLPVVLFGSEDLDVAQVDPASLAFGPGGAAPVHSLRVRRRGDAYPDLLLLFRAAEAGLQEDDTQACLSGSTERFAFEACDAIRVTEPLRPAQPRRRRSSLWR